MRLWGTSVVFGCAISGNLTVVVWATRLAFYFPPFWPGLFFAWVIVILSHGKSWATHFGIALAMIGNAAFYTWISFRVVQAEVVSRGRLSRHFLT
jgi:fatty acid desaturase